jgi:hypothetical protein
LSQHLRTYIYPEKKQPRALILVMAIVGAACAIQFLSQLNDVTDIILHKTSEEPRLTNIYLCNHSRRRLQH